jgi:ABC-type Na+ efflux pump permease subunit
MDKTGITQIGLIVIGFSIISIGIYLIFFNFIISGAIVIVGLGIAQYGYRYPRREQVKKEREARRLEIKQNGRGRGDKIGIWGLGICLTSLGACLVAIFVNLFSIALVAMLFSLIGFIIMESGRFIAHRKRAQANIK